MQPLRRPARQAPVSVAASSQEYLTACTYAVELVQVYFRLLTAGCGDGRCVNVHCASNPSFEPMSATDAAIRSVYFATTEPVALCSAVQIEWEGNHKQEEQPETPEDDGETPKRPCTPRQRLSTAQQLDHGLQQTPSGGNNNIEATSDVAKPQAARRRRMSHTKQKLVDAIKSSFSRGNGGGKKAQPERV